MNTKHHTRKPHQIQMAAMKETRKRAAPDSPFAEYLNTAYDASAMGVLRASNNPQTWAKACAANDAAVEALQDSLGDWHKAEHDTAPTTAVLLSGRAVCVALHAFKDARLDMDNGVHMETMMQRVVWSDDKWQAPSVSWMWIAYHLRLSVPELCDQPLDKILAHVLLRNKCTDEAAFLQGLFAQWPHAVRIDIANSLQEAEWPLRSGDDVFALARQAAVATRNLLCDDDETRAAIDKVGVAHVNGLIRCCFGLILNW